VSAVVVAARRTPIGTAGRGLASADVPTLAAAALRAVVCDLAAPVPAIDDVIMGNCMGPGGNPARVAALLAGLGDGVPGLTVDRQCGSGLEAINLAATMVRAGAGELYLAGGAESASTAPLRFWPGDPPVRYVRAPFAPAGNGDPDMGEAAETVAAEAGIDRARQDAYAARSHAAAAAADFGAELVAVPGGIDRDERPRRGLSATRLARLPAAFVPGGTVTAGNSCGVSDGAAAVAVVSERLRAERGWAGLRILDGQTCGVDPRRPGIGLVPAVRAVLDRGGLTPADLDAVEITEAFAGQLLACLDALGLDERVVCPDGGAIALGHPWGASGAILMVRLFSRLVRAGGDRDQHSEGRRYGLAACAVGGGMGVATLVERVPGRVGAPEARS
jgi:acetyl-CoA C-acetyltransferase